MDKIYSTFDEAVFREIIEPIESTGEATQDDFDIDAIAEEVIQYQQEFDSQGRERVDEAGYFLAVDTETFWKTVERFAR